MRIVGSILHGAYGDLYEQAICLKHYAITHPDLTFKLFFSRPSRLTSFQALDLSFASVRACWTEIEDHDDIDEFLQFQVHDRELNTVVLDHLAPKSLAKFNRDTNLLPWVYMRDNGLLSPPARFVPRLTEAGEEELKRICASRGIDARFWQSPTLAFLWRHRRERGGAISSFGERPSAKLVNLYSAFFARLINVYRCKLLVFGMNIRTTDENRNITDNKYPDYGLDLPPESVVYLKGTSWPIELEIASMADICCGNASGFTEALWIKRGGDVALMDPPVHYVAKAIYHRMPFFSLNDPAVVAGCLPYASGLGWRSTIERTMGYERRSHVRYQARAVRAH